MSLTSGSLSRAEGSSRRFPCSSATTWRGKGSIVTSWDRLLRATAAIRHWEREVSKDSFAPPLDVLVVGPYWCSSTRKKILHASLGQHSAHVRRRSQRNLLLYVWPNQNMKHG
jgi:hypothetical protein